MTISSTVRIAGPYIGSGAATVFPFAFKVFAAAEMQVAKLNTTSNVETILTLTTDYTVQLNGDQNGTPGGTITLPAVLASGYNLTITSDIANLQPTDLTNQGGFYPEVITDALDRATIQIQQLDQNSRAIKIPLSDGVLDMTTPVVAERASKYLAFDAAGLPVVSAGTGSDSALRTDLAVASAVSAGSRLSGFRQTGTGATARTVDAKLKDTVSVNDFGAVGDGVADDTAAIQATITAVGIAGGCIYFPKGTYKITSQLVIYDSNIRLVGDGFKNTTIAASSASFNMMRTTNGKSFISILDLSFLGGATTNATAQYGIIGGTTATDETSNVLIENCRFSNSNNGIVLCSGKYWKVNNCYFDTLIGNISGTGYGILSAESSAYGLFTNNHFTGTAGNGRHAVYMAVGCSYSIASNNVVNGLDNSGFVMSASSLQPGMVENLICNNIIVGGGTVGTTEAAGIYCGGKVSNCVISDNLILNFQNVGIGVYDYAGGLCLNNSVKGNTIQACALSGIEVRGSLQTSVTSNTINQCSTNSSGAVSGIVLSSSGSWGASPAMTNTYISGNTVFGTSHKSSFEIFAGLPYPTNTFIVGNIFTDGTTVGKPVILNEATPVISNYISNATTGLYAYGGNEISRFVSRSSALDFGSIAANTTAELTIAVTANITTTNWSVVVTPETGMESGLVWCAYVSAANTVTVRVANVTIAAIDPASKTFIVDCYKHNS